MTVRDANIPTCYRRVTTQTVNSCYENVECAIYATHSQPIYNNNGTPNNVSDDTFTFEVAVTGQGSSGWTGGGQSGNFGDTRTFGPYPVDEAGAIIEIMDATNTQCSLSVGVNIGSCIFLGTCTCCGSD